MPDEISKVVFRPLFLKPELTESSVKPAQKLSARKAKLPPPQLLPTDNANYIPSDDLCAAVDVAIYLGLPLLVTGEPGMGKTRLAYAVAEQFELPILRFDTKSTSTIQNLLYDYDVLRRFYDAELRKQSAAITSPAGTISLSDSITRNPSEYHDYITFNPLGLAIILGRDPAKDKQVLSRYRFGFNENTRDDAGTNLFEMLNRGNQRCVILIDEIDKAPRDLPNDLLAEMERLRFRILETGDSYEAAPENRPIVIITSNDEKSLPDPFLRRCAYFHIHLPEETEKRRKVLEGIVAARLDCDVVLREAAVEHFETLCRESGITLRKRPAIAELLQWTQLLVLQNFSADDFELDATRNQKEKLEKTYGVLLKDEHDRAEARNWLLPPPK